MCNRQEKETTGMIQCARMGVLLRPGDEALQAKFNAGMVAHGGTIHMLYRFCEKREQWRGRAIEWGMWRPGDAFPYRQNCICHATLGPEGKLLRDDGVPVIFPELPEEAVGCEDPRIVPFDGAFLVFYSAFDGHLSRVAVARTADFRSYEKLGTIEHGMPDKDAFIFPERIGGRIAYMHRIDGKIQLDYFASVEAMLNLASWRGYRDRVQAQTMMAGVHPFECEKIGGGVPPIRTDDGWLLIYHGVDRQRIYHAGAALLDLHDPARIIARLPYPILSPEADFETVGDYNGCVFPQGCYVDRGDLVISYGTADKYTALARISQEELLQELARHHG